MTPNSSERKIVVGLGELLWDLLPEGPRLGGAPANFAVMAGRLGNRAIIASRLGQDSLGSEAYAALELLPVDPSWLQTDPEWPTGAVTVQIKSGEPSYTIHQPAAWDRLTLTSDWLQLARSADAVCFGTLAQRSAASQQTILDFLDATRSSCVRVFDVNLRSPFWTADVLRDCLGRTTLLKLNIAELPQVLRSTRVCPFASAPETEGDLIAAAGHLLEHYPLHLVCVTLGAEGSLLITRDDSHRHRGLATVVRDTVGAGDAFTAALTHYYLQGAPLAVLNEAGNRWGAWLASQSGAMPPVPGALLVRMETEIQAGAICNRCP